MACLLRLPGQGGPGVVTLTTWERDHVVRKDPEVARLVAALKPRWLIGLHHNWHDHAFHYDPLFDFSMAGEGDLVEASGRPFPLVPFDACSFAPECFRSGTSGEKFWDVLYVARAVFFKRIPEFFKCMRSLYDRGERLRTLFLCPVPPGAGRKKDDTVLDVRRLYDSMFNEQEQAIFTLLDMDFRYPFPLDLETLAFFYRASRVFVHFATDERRCRVASYAWASGLPVVAMEPVGSLLPATLRHPPYFFHAGSFEEFPDLILAARDASAAADAPSVQAPFRVADTVPKLDHALAQLCQARGIEYREDLLAGRSLDIRLGRHHVAPASTNTLGQPLSDFLKRLAVSPSELEAHFHRPDPERSMAGQIPAAAGSAKPASLWGRVRHRLATRFGE